MTYTNYSGGAYGADKHWKIIGEKYGLETIDFKTESLSEYKDLEKEIEDIYRKVCSFLKRPVLDIKTKSGQLVRRNYFQTYFSYGVFAIGDLVKPNTKDKKGFINRSENVVVSGGTAYAVTYAILVGKPVYVFNQDDNQWYTWNDSWVEVETPILTQKFAGIGTREISKNGIEAIKSVYKKTFG